MLSLSAFGLSSSAIRASKRFGVTNSFVFLAMTVDGEVGGVDDVDKGRLPSLGVISLFLILFLLTILLLTIVIGETVG